MEKIGDFDGGLYKHRFQKFSSKSGDYRAPLYIFIGTLNVGGEIVNELCLSTYSVQKSQKQIANEVNATLFTESGRLADEHRLHVMIDHYSPLKRGRATKSDYLCILIGMIIHTVYTLLMPFLYTLFLYKKGTFTKKGIF